MDAQEKDMLVKVLELSEDNNRMLKALHRNLWWARIRSVVYWVVIIGIALGAFYFLQPYIDKVMKLYQEAETQLQLLRPGA